MSAKQQPSLKEQFIALLVLAPIAFAIYFFFIRESSDEKSARLAAEALQQEKNRTAGFHCLSSWDGSHSTVVQKVKEQLRDPNSFEHVETKITPVNNSGEHGLLMQYRANNAFGGKTVGLVKAVVKNSNCSATILSIE